MCHSNDLIFLWNNHFEVIGRKDSIIKSGFYSFLILILDSLTILHTFESSHLLGNQSKTMIWLCIESLHWLSFSWMMSGWLTVTFWETSFRHFIKVLMRNRYLHTSWHWWVSSQKYTMSISLNSHVINNNVSSRIRALNFTVLLHILFLLFHLLCINTYLIHRFRCSIIAVALPYQLNKRGRWFIFEHHWPWI